MEPDDLIDVTQAAQLAECSRNTIKRAIRAGKIDAFRRPGFGLAWWMKPDDVRAWAAPTPRLPTGDEETTA